MSAPVNVPGVGLGVLWRATVASVDSTTTTIATYVNCDALARGYKIGPLPTLVPGLSVGEMVLIGCIGSSRQDMVVLSRWSPRWPSISEVPGLASAIAGTATSDEFARALDRLDAIDARENEFHVRLRDIQVQLGRTVSKVEETPDAIERARQDRIQALTAAQTALQANIDAAVSTMRAATFGASYRTAQPAVELRQTQDIPGLAANTDYTIGGNWSVFRDTEAAAGRAAMGAIGDPTTVKIPVDGDGDYDIEYVIRTTGTAGQAAIKVMLNANNTASIVSRVNASSIYSDVGFATLNEGTRARIFQTARLSAGDVLTFDLWSSVACTLTAVYLGGVRTRIRVTRRVS